MDLDDFHFNPSDYFKETPAEQPDNVPDTPAKVRTKQDVERQAEPRRVRIFQNFTRLGAILDRHEAAIHKRWLKKTKVQRRRILLSAWINDADANGSNSGSRGVLNLIHRPDFAVIYHAYELNSAGKTVNRDACLLVHLNQEDLSQSRPLLLMMRSRARHSPAVFAASDLDDVRLGVSSKGLLPLMLNPYIMMFSGREFPATPPDKYGELIHWKDHPHGSYWSWNRRAPNVAEGLLILEVQDRILAFLVACAKEILHGFTEEQLTSSNPDVAVTALEQQSTASQALELDRSNEALSWATLAAEAPYRSPRRLDFDKLGILLVAARDAAADHILALREDPGCWADQLNLAREHRIEMLTDTSGDSHPLFTSGREDVFWMRVIENEINSAYLYFEIWNELCEQAATLYAMHRDLPELSAEDDLPDDFMSALLHFQHYLNQATKGSICDLQMTLAASPPLRQYFVYPPLSGPDDISVMQVTQKLGVEMDEHVEKLLWLLFSLWQGDRISVLGLVRVVDEVQRLIEKESSAKAAISNFVAAIIANLAVACECLRLLYLFQPWANTFTTEFLNRKTAIETEYAQHTAPCSQMYNGLLKNEELLYAFGAPLLGRFDYPIDKRRTRENVEAMCQAECDLDLFWSKVDEVMSRELDGTRLAHHFVSPHGLLRTVPWLEEQTGKDAAPRKDSKQDEAAHFEELLRGLSVSDHGSEGEVVELVFGSVVCTVRRQKTTAQPLDNSEVTINHDPLPTMPPLPTCRVDARALKTFRTLFYTPSATATPGELAWHDFLHALASVGFTAQKLYGSAWQFFPPLTDWPENHSMAPPSDGSIQFHEPHPGGKLAFRVARQYARRLNRAYGWTGEMFVLATLADSALNE